jgi:hypothetical protein
VVRERERKKGKKREKKRWALLENGIPIREAQKKKK